MSKALSIASLTLTLIFPILACGAALAVQPEGEITFETTCREAWCENDRDNAYMKAQAQAIINAQLAPLGCSTKRELTPNVAVRNAQTTKAEQARGLWRHDLNVVRKVPFDTAFAEAKAGRVWVVGFCPDVQP